jgi:hypothetical protein
MLKTRSVAPFGAYLVGLACSFASSGCDQGSDNKVSSVPPTNAAQEAQYKARAAAAEKQGPPKAAPRR